MQTEGVNAYITPLIAMASAFVLPLAWILAEQLLSHSLRKRQLRIKRLLMASSGPEGAKKVHCPPPSITERCFHQLQKPILQTTLGQWLALLLYLGANVLIIFLRAAADGDLACSAAGTATGNLTPLFLLSCRNRWIGGFLGRAQWLDRIKWHRWY